MLRLLLVTARLSLIVNRDGSITVPTIRQGAGRTIFRTFWDWRGALDCHGLDIARAPSVRVLVPNRAQLAPCQYCREDRPSAQCDCMGAGLDRWHAAGGTLD